MKAKILKEYLNGLMEQLECVPDDCNIKLKPNSYRMELPILEFSEGFISLEEDLEYSKD